MLVNPKMNWRDWDLIIKIVTAAYEYEAEDIFQEKFRERVEFHMQSWRTIIDGVAIAPNIEYRIESKKKWVAYGSADSPLQILEREKSIRQLLDDGKNIFVTFCPLYREDEPERNGWRWHKNGPYIGDQNPRCEHIYDDGHINMIYTYDVFLIEDENYTGGATLEDAIKVLREFRLEDVNSIPPDYPDDVGPPPFEPQLHSDNRSSESK